MKNMHGLAVFAGCAVVLGLSACGRASKEHHEQSANLALQTQEIPIVETIPGGAGSGGAGPGVQENDRGQTNAPDGLPGPVREDAALNDATANFRGFLLVNDIVTQRLMLPGSTFFFGRYLDLYSRDFIFGLAQLLGYEVGDGVSSEFRNGKPNAINMVLWHLSLASLAHDIALHCQDEQPAEASPVTLKPAFQETLRLACAWPAPEARSTGTLARLWQGVMSYDAPRSELDAFTAFFQGDAYAQATGQEAVEAMLTAMLYNPHFLVRK